MLWSTFLTFLAFVPFIFAKPVTVPHRHGHGHVQRSSIHRRLAGRNAYRVVYGDTTDIVAAAYSTTYSALSAANPNTDMANLKAPSVITNPSNRLPYRYSIVAGDTRASIAAKYNVYSDDVLAANPNVAWDSPPAGTVIRVPGYGQATTYKVTSGDTGDIIATSFGISFDSLSNANPGVTWTSLQIDQILNVPTGVSPTKGNLPSPATTTTSSSSTTSSATTTSSSTTTSSATTTSSSSSTSSSKTTTSSSTTAVSTTTSSSSSAITTTSSQTTSTTIASRSFRQLTTATTTRAGLPTTTSSSTTSSTASTTKSTTTLITTTSSSTTSSTASTTKSTTTSSSSTSTTKSTTTTTTSSAYTGEPQVTPTATVTGSNYVKGGVANDGVASRADTYTFYQGDGSKSAGWPSKSEWISFATMKKNLAPWLGTNCQSIFGVANNSPAENQYIYNAIEAIATNSGVDHRLILSSIMQESSGCVRVKTTISADKTVRNPGLMQDFNGSGTCNGDAGILNPCPASQIYQMISDGVFGTSSDGGKTYVAGLVQDINSSPTYTDAQVIYRATRIYNSGSIPGGNDLGAPGATRCYASDMANRLMGWILAERTCTLDKQA